jgi:predicted amidohydrolase YtcJ
MQLYADILFTAGRVYTADPSTPWVEAVAVRDGKILATGRAEQLAELLGPQTEVIPLGLRLLLPGFTESHIHLPEAALRALEVEAAGAISPEQVAALAAERVGATPAGAWIRGGGWDASLWAAGSQAHRAILDAVTGDIPVALDSKDLHSIWLNTAALRRAGITAETPDVPGGVIERGADGSPTGVLRENAIGLLDDAIPEPGLPEITTAMEQFFPGLWAAGIVAVHNANDSDDGRSLRAYQLLRGSGRLGVRAVQHIPSRNLRHALAMGLRSGLGDPWLRIGGVKFFADGALGSRTANMLRPYLNEPDNWGVSTMDPEEMLEQALAASRGGLSLTIHAIGDRANRDVLNVLEEVRRQEANRAPASSLDSRLQPVMDVTEKPTMGSTPTTALRHRIEHVQCIDPADLPRLAALDIIASVQPIHATSDMLMADRHWGPDRTPNSYAYRSLLDSGAVLVFGSDAPVDIYPPLAGIHAAVTRRRCDGSPGPQGWQGQERVTVAEAIDAYTRWPAYAAGEEDYRGTITPGKVADLVLLEEDIFRIDPMAILDTPVAMTVLDGKVVHRR